MTWTFIYRTDGLEMKGAGPTKKREMPLVRKPMKMNLFVPCYVKVQ